MSGIQIKDLSFAYEAGGKLIFKKTLIQKSEKENLSVSLGSLAVVRVHCLAPGRS